MKNLSALLGAVAALAHGPSTRRNPQYLLDPAKLLGVRNDPAFLGHAPPTNLKRWTPRRIVQFAYQDGCGNMVNRVRQAKKARALSGRQETRLRRETSRVSRCQKAGHYFTKPSTARCHRCGAFPVLPGKPK